MRIIGRAVMHHRAMAERLVYKDILLRAACRVGSSAELAQRLQVSHDSLRAWMRGDDEPPASIVLLALVILESRLDAPYVVCAGNNPMGASMNDRRWLF
jgi:hypothetical protein